MKPFDLEAAKRGEPIITRDGRPAEFIAHVQKAQPGHQVIVLITGCVGLYFEDGSFTDCRSDRDLFMATRKRIVYVNMYPRAVCSYWETQELADKVALPSRIGSRAYPIEIEE